ncbi:odorant receptor 13a-like isoform X3 [Polyergus mexicanus]|uniref:odorant receptor 13a-like isoform X3 n=1 Tax=Polyergus mexicanus TaxID=615972 RepID=UPI0038B4C65B
MDRSNRIVLGYRRFLCHHVHTVHCYARDHNFIETKLLSTSSRRNAGNAEIHGGQFLTIALIHSGLCFCCFDNLLGLLNMHTAGQFKMLQHRLETIFQNIERKDSVEFFDGKREHQVFEEIIECVTIHRKLIWYSERMEYFFMYTTLAQLLVSSVLLCVSGLQIFLGHNMTIVRRMIFVAHAIACFFQLFLVTCTSNDLIDESRAIGDAAYNANWQVLSHDNNKGVRNAVLMIMIRAMRPCSISAGGFFPVSLETFMTVLSTAVSYFTLLRKFLGEQGI